MMHLFRTISAGSLIATAMGLIGCGGAGQVPAGQAPQASLLLGQAKRKNHCTTPCIYVANELSSSVTIYPENANGNVAPAGSLSGSNTGLNDVWGVAFDAANNIYVANFHGGLPNDGSVTVYPARSRGNAAPIATITGQPSGNQMINPSDVALDAAGDIYVPGYFSNSVSVYAPGANGDPAPIRYISGSNTDLNQPSYLYVTPKGKLYVANFGGMSVNVYAPGANGNVAPVRMITGTKTGMDRASGVAVDDRGKIYVSSVQPGTPSGCCVTVYGKNANGNVAPIRTISGGQTGLTGPDGIALDSNDNIYVTQYPPSGASPSVTVFEKGANGNVVPIRTIAGSKTGIDGPAGITVH
jgi:hypothetical protein